MTETNAPVAAPIILPPLSPEEKEQLRQRVLAGQRLDLDTAKRISITLRGERRSAAESAATRAKKKSTRKKGMTDAELDADLDNFLGLTRRNAAGEAIVSTASGDLEPEGAPAGDLAPDLDIS